MYPNDLRRFSGALLLPQPLTFHKPNRSGSGTALKLNTRFKFEFGEKPGAGDQPPEVFLKKSRGGLWVDFAKQGPMVGEHATFKWTDRATLVTAKLGLPDLSAMLVANRSVRSQGTPVPPELRPLAREADDQQTAQRKQLTVAMTHKSRQGDKADATTIISYQFGPTGGVFRVSKSRELVGQVQLTLAEELRFFRYCEMALDTIMRVGGR